MANSKEWYAQVKPRFERICPTHYRPVVSGLVEPLCPEGPHSVPLWWIARLEDRRVVAAASMDIILLAFEVESKLDRRQIAASRDSLPQQVPA